LLRPSRIVVGIYLADYADIDQGYESFHRAQDFGRVADCNQYCIHVTPLAYFQIKKANWTAIDRVIRHGFLFRALHHLDRTH
ncbi:MAG: hypothetical protein AB7F78_14740, partial [Hyphomicrobiaceae bacterium]